MKRIRPIVRRPGGKSRLLGELLPLPDHHTYVEPFAGGLAVLLAKEPSPVEIVNDLDDELVCLYRVAQFHLEALVTELTFMLHSRKNLKGWLKQRGVTDIQRAGRYLARNRCSFGGDGQSYAVVRKAGGGLSSRANVEALLRAFNTRLDRVRDGAVRRSREETRRAVDRHSR
jgi:DNA adenine methylase